MNILITNDDGIEATNLMALASAAMECANVKVTAPQSEQSGVGHSFSYYRSLHFAPAKNFPCEAFWVDGTPADCMKFALKHIYKDFKFDLVISGVNNGDNAGVASFYSGTVGAAREAALWGLPAIAVSLQKQSDEALKYALEWVQKILRNKSFAGMPSQTLWNFNVPPCSKENSCKGVRVSATSTSMFNDYYVEAEKSKNYMGEETIYLLNSDSKVAAMQSSNETSLKAYNLMGNKITDLKEGTDDWWLNQGYASLSPQSVNLTDYEEHKRLKKLEEQGF
ncbi:MAG: 5'/3'-nucleotidase SurE [Fibromonadaceae bacterium]|jgi:5'-nucleotidase|nr:5'/3'-nucleotidase SurE [Fibromonadaceae bacterium]